MDRPGHRTLKTDPANCEIRRNGITWNSVLSSDYFKANIALAAYNFLKSPPASDTERAKVNDQMQVLLDDIREKAGQAGYDPQITNQGIEEAKLFLKRVNAPGLYGKVMRPVSDGQLAEMRKGIPERLRAETVRGNSERRPASDPPPNPVGRAAKRLMFECVPASERIEQPGAAESKLIERLRSAYENKHSLLEKLRHDTRKQSLMSSTSQPTSGKAKK